MTGGSGAGRYRPVRASKYGEHVKVYTMGPYSKEICGGPHATNTGDLKSFKIQKEESFLCRRAPHQGRYRHYGGRRNPHSVRETFRPTEKQANRHSSFPCCDGFFINAFG